MRAKFSILLDDPAIRAIDEELRSEREGERERRIRFSAAFPGISAIPGAGHLARWCYSIGVVPIAGLFAIVVLFTAIKAPYFGMSFTGGHAMKYSTYVEAAQHMAEKNDPTWYQLKYQSDPVHKPNGIFKKFWHIPLYEWGLFATYKILPSGSIETKTRIFAHGIGILILTSGFFFFRRWVPEKLSLLIVFLMAINPIISFSTFVTVLDSLAILFTLTSLVLLNGYFDSRKVQRLFWAGILFGIGLCVKYSMLLWCAPIGLMLLYFRRENIVAFLRNFAIYGLLGVLCIVANRTSISKLPSEPLSALLMFGIWVLIFSLIYAGIKKYGPVMDKVLGKIYASKAFLSVSLLFLLAAGAGVIKVIGLEKYADESLTDLSLLLNSRVYAYMLRIQFKSFMTPVVFWLGFVGIAIVFCTRGGSLKKVASAFLVGSAVYWVAASKAIFIHNYYTIIIMITFSLLSAAGIYYMLMNFSHMRIKIILSLMFLALIFPQSFRVNVAGLNPTEDISEVIQFILNNTTEDDLILNETGLSPITIYTGRGLIYPLRIVDHTIREEIQSIGFAETMKKYRIKYLFTSNETPLYIDFAPVFAKTQIVEPSYNRNHMIFKLIGDNDIEMNRQYQELEDIVKKYKISEKFRLEAKVGNYRFYSFVN